MSFETFYENTSTRLPTSPPNYIFSIYNKTNKILFYYLSLKYLISSK